MRVFVYFNLHRQCWSIKALEGPSKGRVIGHADYVNLACVEWRVSEAGRQRVLREKKKNVHAGAVGTLEKWSGIDGKCRKLCEDETLHEVSMQTDEVPDMVTYNPYRGSTFIDKDTGEPVRKSRSAYLTRERHVYVYGRA